MVVWWVRGLDGHLDNLTSQINDTTIHHIQNLYFSHYYFCLYAFIPWYFIGNVHWKEDGVQDTHTPIFWDIRHYCKLHCGHLILSRV